MNSYCVYIMAGQSGVLYIGVTNDLERRVLEHKQKAVPGFTARYNLTKLVYFEAFGDVRHAIAREKGAQGLGSEKEGRADRVGQSGMEGLESEMGAKSG